MRLSLRAVSMFLLVLLFGAVGSVRAQSIETPTPFDSAHRVLSVTPPLAARLGLVAPVWPVGTSDYRAARLFGIEPTNGTNGYVLVVERPSGALERYLLTDAQRRSLQLVVDSAMTASGHPSSGVDVASEPAGNSFARRQLLMAAFVYGPLAASLASDGPTAGALYLAMTGATFFASYGAAQSESITRAQSHLAADMGLGAGAAGWLLGYAATGNNDRGVRAIALGSGLAGTVAGAMLGRALTDAEAHSGSSGIETGAAVAWSASTLAGLSSRPVAATIAGGEAIGYGVGVLYPRHAGYTVTAGDVDAVQTAGLVGALASGALFFTNNHPSHKEVAGVMGSGYVVGLAIGDLAIARPLDLTSSDAALADVGAVAGGLIGLALPVAAGGNLAASMGFAGAGAAIGMAVMLGAMHPAPAVGAASRRSCSVGVVGLGVGYGCRF